MRSLLAPALLLAASLLAPSAAHANQCSAGRAMLANPQIPIGCSIRAYLPTTATLADVKLEVQRGSSYVDVTGTVTAVGAIDIPVHYDEPDFANECEPTTHVAPYSYQAFDVTFTGVSVGETIQIDAYRPSQVVAAGACPTPSTFDGTDWIQCSAGVQEYQACYDMLCTPFASPTADCNGSGSNDPTPGTGDSGCAASSGASLGALGGPIGLLVVAFARYRRRRSCV